MNRHGSVNRIYRLVWSVVRSVWIPVAEKARGRGKRSGGKLIAAVFALGAAGAEGAPSGGQVISGSGNISHSGVTTTITQASANLSLTWKSFDIAPLESVTFKQPSASSIAVNRIFETNGTQILGHLYANGQVFLINPNGIVFGPTAQVNVGSLVASTLDLSDSSIDSNAKSFSGSGSGSVVNEGVISAAVGGYVALLGSHVKNAGVITAQLGTVALGAGRAVTLTFGGPKGVQVQVNESDLNALAENGGLIRADGGQVLMTAGAKNSLLASVVNNTGVIEARTVEAHDGTITLLGGMSAGTVNVAGTLDASAPAGGNGGAIETSAEHVHVADKVKVTTAASAGLFGSWLIDPNDFTVAAAGGDITGLALSNALALGSVDVLSSGGGAAGSGSVNVNDAVSWSASTTLTLTAANNVNINANMVATGDSAGLILNPRTANGADLATVSGAFNLAAGHSITLSGATPSLFIDGAAYIVINDLGAQGSVTGTDLQGINGNLAGHYALGVDVDAAATSGWNAGAGFAPISTFNGTFDGLGHTISNLYINAATFHAGLFGVSSPGSIVQNVGLVAADVRGQDQTGALVGRSYSLITNSYSTGSVRGTSGVGGLVGVNYGGGISNSYSTAAVTGGSAIGGLIGVNGDAVTDSHATGAVVGAGYDSGGLVGLNNGSIARSYATGNVTNTGGETGGLVGYESAGSISTSYATGNVSSYGLAGGLAGTIDGGSVSDSYATGSVTANQTAGGLVGANNYGSITRSYAVGAVTGALAGGLVGSASDGAFFSGDFWNKSVNAVGIGTAEDPGALGLTTAEMMTASNFSGAGWDIASVGGTSAIWRIYPGSTAPLLRSFLTPLTVTADNVSKVYGGASPGALANASYSVAGAPGSGHLFGLGDPYAGIANVGVAAPTVYSDQLGYDISYVNAALTVTPATLTVLADSASKIYGQVNPALSGTVSGFVGSDTLANATTGTEVFATAATATSNVGTYAVTGSGLVANNSNYIFSAAVANATALSITPATLTVTANAASKIYGQANPAFSGTVTGFVGTDTLVNATNGTEAFTSAALPTTNVGSYAVTGAGLVANNGNYIFSAAAANATALSITAATLTVTSNLAIKVYGQANPAFSGTVTGFVGTDTLANATTGTETFTSPATTSSNTGNYAVTGAGLVANNGNYSFTQAASNASRFAITPALLIVTANPASKVYGQANPAFSGTVTGFVGTDTLANATTGTETFTSAATNTSDTGSYAVTGSGLAFNNNNYFTLPAPANATALTITPAPLTVTGEIAANKTYDGGTASILTGGTLSGVLFGDAVTLNQSGQFVSKNVGGAVAVTATDTLTGADAGNYLVSQPTGLNAAIVPATLTLTADAASRAYGQLNPEFSGSVTGFVGGDTLANATTGSAFTSSAVRATSVGSYAITAADLSANNGNYNFIEAEGNASALTITRAALTVQGESAANKTYDGNTAATLTGGTLVGLLAGDAVSLTQAGSFASKNAGTAIAVTTADSLSGAGAGNYTLMQPAGLVASINPLALAVLGEQVDNKVYDGTSAATLTGASLSGVLAGDSVTLSQTGSFAAKNVGTGVAVTATDSLSGASAANYSVTQPTGLAANITPATLTYDAAAASFSIGQALAPLSGTLTGFVADDTKANSTSGVLTWTTTARSTGPAGLYPIVGGGLTAANYVFAEAGGDATALALLSGPSGSSPNSFLVARNAVTSIEANLPASNTSVHLAMLDPEFVSIEANAGSSVSLDSGNANVAAAESGTPIPDWIAAHPAQAPVLRIERGGVKLPDYEVAINAR